MMLTCEREFTRKAMCFVDFTRFDGSLKVAEKVCMIAEAWGNRVAKSWVKNRGFMQYLTVSNLLSFKF